MLSFCTKPGPLTKRTGIHTYFPSLFAGAAACAASSRLCPQRWEQRAPAASVRMDVLLRPGPCPCNSSSSASRVPLPSFPLLSRAYSPLPSSSVPILPSLPENFTCSGVWGAQTWLLCAKGAYMLCVVSPARFLLSPWNRRWTRACGSTRSGARAWARRKLWPVSAARGWLWAMQWPWVRGFFRVPLEGRATAGERGRQKAEGRGAGVPGFTGDYAQSPFDGHDRPWRVRSR